MTRPVGWYRRRRLLAERIGRIRDFAVRTPWPWESRGAFDRADTLQLELDAMTATVATAKLHGGDSTCG